MTNLVLLEKYNFWSDLTDDQKLMLISSAHSVTLSGNQSIYSSDMPCEGLLLIKKGVLRTYALSEEGREVTLYRQSTGEACVMTSSCAIKTLDMEVHIDTSTDTQCLMIPYEIVQHLVENNIRFENFILKEIADKFSKVLCRFQELIFKKLDRRLADYLLMHIKQTKGYIITKTHEEIAVDLGSAREVISRMLKYFESEGWLTLSRKKIEIIDVDAISRIKD